MTAYKAGLKGITVYRESSREGILISEDQKAKEDGESSETEVVETNTTETSARRASGELRPRIRPGETRGVTKRIRTGEGSLYITINEDEKGLCEVFTTIGKAGGNAAAQSEAISRLISLALRSGIDPVDVVKQLKGISGPTPTWENGQLILSTPDAIGKALESYLYERPVEAEDTPEEVMKTRFTMVEGPQKPETANYNPRTMTTCPDCGSDIFHENGCVTCPSCGFSKCE
jgi:ribonucleoside-diphosphate reductase alpha chain